MTEKLLVTDTHPLVFFFCGEKRRLGRKALQAFTEAVSSTSTSIFVPTPVIWELSLLEESGKITIDRPFADWIDRLFQYSAINPIAFDLETVKIFHRVSYHDDPFDRAIVATALQLDLPLITNDSQMHKHRPCEIVW